MSEPLTMDEALERVIKAGWGGFSLWTMQRDGSDKMGCLLNGRHTGGEPLEPNHSTNCNDYHDTVDSLLQDLVKTAEEYAQKEQFWEKPQFAGMDSRGLT